MIECDAYGVGIGVVLMQNQKPLDFLSQALKCKHLLLSTYENELLALVLVVKKWKFYLLGIAFIIRTEHHNLKYVLEQKVGIAAQQKWISKLLDYKFAIEYKKGPKNKVVYALSKKGRIYIPDCLELKLKILNFIHASTSASHSGFDKSLQRARHDFYWPGLKKKVKKYIKKCDICQRNKVENVHPTSLLQPLHVP